MTTMPRSSEFIGARRRRFDVRRHTRTACITSIVIALQSISSIELFRSDRVTPAAAITFEMTARLRLPGTGCGSLTARFSGR
jgi:hypothetical protein